MTVAELIARLSDLPQNSEVFIYDEPYGPRPPDPRIDAYVPGTVEL